MKNEIVRVSYSNINWFTFQLIRIDWTQLIKNESSLLKVNSLCTNIKSPRN